MNSLILGMPCVQNAKIDGLRCVVCCSPWSCDIWHQEAWTRGSVICFQVRSFANKRKSSPSGGNICSKMSLKGSQGSGTCPSLLLPRETCHMRGQTCGSSPWYPSGCNKQHSCHSTCLLDVNKIVPINILEAYRPTVIQYSLHYSSALQLLLTRLAGIFSLVQITQTAPQLKHQRVASSMLCWPIPLTCWLTRSPVISGPRSILPGLSAAFSGKPYTIATPPKPSVKSASHCSHTGGTSSLHCWDRSMGSQICSSKSGREGLCLVPVGLTWMDRYNGTCCHFYESWHGGIFRLLFFLITLIFWYLTCST